MANIKDVKEQIKNKETQLKQTPTIPTQELTLRKALSHVFPLRIFLISAQENPKLAECTPQSIIGAVVNCATLGLEPGLLGHVYLIPYKNNTTGCVECQFQIGYKGYIDLIQRSGNVQNITVHTVYENDGFDYEYGLEEKLYHKPAKSHRGKAIFYYSTYRLRDGGRGFEVLSREDAEIHRDKFSKSKKYGPWVEHFDAMALKTVIKQMVKWMPISIDIQQSISLDSQTINIKEDVKDAQEVIDVFDYGYADDTSEVA